MKTVALIGCGYWGGKLIPYINERFALKRILASKNSIRPMLKDKKIDGVIIATPIDTHYELAKQVVLAGKHVFVEKPLAMDSGECRELKALASAANVKIGVEYTQTFSRGIREAIVEVKKDFPEYIEMSTKHLGRFKKFDVKWLLASHWLSVLDMVIPLDHFYMREFAAMETSSLMLKSLGTKVRIDVSLNNPEKEMKAAFYCSNRTVVYDGMSNDTLKVVEYKKKVLTPGEEFAPDKVTAWRFDEKNNLRHSMEYFDNLMRGKTESNLERAIRVTNTIQNVEVL